MGLILHKSCINGLFEKNFCLEQMCHLGPRMSHPAVQLWISKVCFTILHNETPRKTWKLY